MHPLTFYHRGAFFFFGFAVQSVSAPPDQRRFMENFTEAFRMTDGVSTSSSESASISRSIMMIVTIHNPCALTEFEALILTVVEKDTKTPGLSIRESVPLQRNHLADFGLCIHASLGTTVVQIGDSFSDSNDVSLMFDHCAAFNEPTNFRECRNSWQLLQC